MCVIDHCVCEFVVIGLCVVRLLFAERFMMTIRSSHTPGPHASTCSSSSSSSSSSIHSDSNSNSTSNMNSNSNSKHNNNNSNGNSTFSKPRSALLMLNCSCSSACSRTELVSGAFALSSAASAIWNTTHQSHVFDSWQKRDRFHSHSQCVCSNPGADKCKDCSIRACHPWAGAMLMFSASFQV